MGYRGQIADFPCGIGGLNGNQNVYQIPISDLVIARNIRFTDFAIRKAPGLSFFDDNAVGGAEIARGIKVTLTAGSHTVRPQLKRTGGSGTMQVSDSYPWNLIIQ